MRRKYQNKHQFSIARILAWADAHYRRTGQWPKLNTGAIQESGGDTWATVQASLVHGCRGLPGGSSLAQLLATHRGVRNKSALPLLSREAILRWADAHYQLTGTWPNYESGLIPDAPGETWKGVDMALRQGHRGLPGLMSLAKLLAEHRGVRNRNRSSPPSLTIARILAWADAHFQRTGQWPTARAGPIKEAPGETWLGVEMALYQGRRGLPGGSSIARLLRKHRGSSARFNG